VEGIGALEQLGGALESIGAARESMEKLRTTTLRGEPLNCSLGFFF